MADKKPILHLPSLQGPATSENPKPIKSPTSRSLQLAVAQTTLHKQKTRLMRDNLNQESDAMHFFNDYENSAKPKLLQDLEKFLEKELQILKVTENEYNELTFLAHREVFEYLIDNFKTYKPLLSRIKTKYEIRMNQLKRQIQSMKPLKQMAATAAERYEHRIMALQEQDKQKLIQLKSTNRELYKRATSLLKRHQDAEFSMEKLKEETENMRLKYIEQTEQRQFLVTKMNDLRFQIERLEETKSQRQEDPQEDPVTIRAAISEARQREKISSQKMNEMVADYSDLIPKPQFIEFEEKYQAISEEREKIMNEFKTLKTQHSDLLIVHTKLTDERNYCYIECEKLKKIEKAMDHWNKCIDFINGGQTSWQEVSSGTSCQNLIEILQEMITQNSGYIAITGNVAVESTVYTGLGMDRQVPEFLRYKGEVQGHRMLVRDCCLMVADIWATRAKDTQPDRKPLVQFLHDYLRQIIPHPNERFKWAYTFNAACQKLAQNYDNINLFLDILNGQADEYIYHARQELSSNLLLSLREAEKRRQEEKKKETEEANAEQPAAGFMTQEEFGQELMQFFDLTRPEDKTFLLKAALQLQTKNNIEYEKLFILDDEGEVGPFLTAINDWQEETQTEFLNQVRQIGFGSTITVPQLKNALQKVGPHLDTTCIDRLVNWVFESSAQNPDASVPVEAFDRLNMTFIPIIHKQTKKDTP